MAPDGTQREHKASPRMCNLYRMTKAPDEVAHLFSAISIQPGNAASEVYPGYPGLVFARGELRSMTWGFPLAMKGKSGQPLKPKPINNARADKLDSFMWRYSFAERRCLIPELPPSEWSIDYFSLDHEGGMECH
jgi:putative SOS response-associated peptidase YedK